MVKRRLTADDPEPPVGSVMLGEGGAWQRASDGWYATGLIDSQEWYELFEYEPTLTLVYRGPDPEAQTTWTPGDPLPLVGTIVSRPGLKPKPAAHWALRSSWRALRWMCGPCQPWPSMALKCKHARH